MVLKAYSSTFLEMNIYIYLCSRCLTRASETWQNNAIQQWLEEGDGMGDCF